MTKSPLFYSCAVCGRNTAKGKHGSDAAGCGLCSQCYDLSGLENTLSDNGSIQESERAQVVRLISTLAMFGRVAAVAEWNAIFETNVSATALASDEPAAGTGPKLGRQHKVLVKIGEREEFYSSTFKAFVALNLPVAKHQAFRKVLKATGRNEIVCERGAHHYFTAI